jgi:hypothetical protein
LDFGTGLVAALKMEWLEPVLNEDNDGRFRNGCLTDDWD